MSADPDWRTVLTRRRAALTADLAAAADASAPVELDQTRVGRLSRMDAMQAQAMSRAADTRRELELQQIEAALERLAAGTFGQCLRCGEDIATARLEFAPANPLCLGCAQAAET